MCIFNFTLKVEVCAGNGIAVRRVELAQAARLSSCAQRLQGALDFYRGHFLADLPIADSEVFEEWAAPRREHLLQRALSALERLVEWTQWRGAYPEALAYAQRLVALEPLLEAHQRALMRLPALNGELTAALAQYRQFRMMLAQELALEPEEATTALFDQLRRGDTAGLRPAPPPFVVPEPPTPLANRTGKPQAICARLRDQKARAMTITGTGGIGKTRLALEAARAALRLRGRGLFRGAGRAQWAMEHGVYETTLRMATGVWRFHWMAGQLREGLERLEAALAYREQAPWKAQADALRAAGILVGGLNDCPRAASPACSPHRRKTRRRRAWSGKKFAILSKAAPGNCAIRSGLTPSHSRNGAPP